MIHTNFMQVTTHKYHKQCYTIRDVVEECLKNHMEFVNEDNYWFYVVEDVVIYV